MFDPNHHRLGSQDISINTGSRSTVEVQSMTSRTLSPIYGSGPPLERPARFPRRHNSLKQAQSIRAGDNEENYRQASTGPRYANNANHNPQVSTESLLKNRPDIFVNDSKDHVNESGVKKAMYSMLTKKRFLPHYIRVNDWGYYWIFEPSKFSDK